MDIWNQIADNVLGITAMLVICAIPVLCGMFVIRRLGNATKKTINVFRK